MENTQNEKKRLPLMEIALNKFMELRKGASSETQALIEHLFEAEAIAIEAADYALIDYDSEEELRNCAFMFGSANARDELVKIQEESGFNLVTFRGEEEE